MKMLEGDKIYLGDGIEVEGKRRARVEHLVWREIFARRCCSLWCVVMCSDEERLVLRGTKR